MFFEGGTVLTENWFAIMPEEQRQGWMRAARMTAALAEKRGERQKMRLLLQKIIFAIRLFLRRHETAEVADLYRIGTIAVAQAEESNTRPKRKRTGGGRSFPNIVDLCCVGSEEVAQGLARLDAEELDRHAFLEMAHDAALHAAELHAGSKRDAAFGIHGST